MNNYSVIVTSIHVTETTLMLSMESLRCVLKIKIYGNFIYLLMKIVTRTKKEIKE